MTTSVKSGLVLAFILALLDTATLFAFGDSSSDRPSDAVIVIGGVLGVVGLVATVWAWRSRELKAFQTMAAIRVISALGGVVLAIGGSTGEAVFTIVFLAITAVSLYLMRTALRPSGSSGSPSLAA